MDDQRTCMVAHERPPALRRPAVAWRSVETRGPILADRTRRDLPGRAGGYPTGPPTDPDVRNERIRFLGHQSGGTTLAHHCAALHGHIRGCGQSWVWGGQRSVTASRTSPTQPNACPCVDAANTARPSQQGDGPPP